MLLQLKAERDELLSQLEDEKKKNEELQFRFEEATITKGDIEVSSINPLLYFHAQSLNLQQNITIQNVSESVLFWISYLMYVFILLAPCN